MIELDKLFSKNLNFDSLQLNNKYYVEKLNKYKFCYEILIEKIQIEIK